MLSKKLPGLTVVHIDIGVRLGTVRGILLDPATKRTTALLVNLTQGWMRKGLLAIEHVYAIGDQAVTVEDEAHLVMPDEENDLWARWKDRVDLHGMPILTERGEGLGVVDAFDFDLMGRITEIAIRQGVWKRFKGQAIGVPGAAIRSFGRDAVIVKAEFVEELQAQPAAGQGSREKTTAVGDATDTEAQKALTTREVPPEADVPGASLPARLWQRVRHLGSNLDTPSAKEETLQAVEVAAPGPESNVESAPQPSQGEQLDVEDSKKTEGEVQSP